MRIHESFEQSGRPIWRSALKRLSAGDSSFAVADDFAARQAATPSPVPTHPSIQSEVGAPPSDLSPAASTWRGITGRAYRHTAHTFIFCPAPTNATYILARRDRSGDVVPLYVGLAASDAASLNLAHIRRRGARLGATEVHLCPIARTVSLSGMRRVAHDLRAAFE